VYYTRLTQSVVDGSFTTAPYYGSIEDNIVALTPLNKELAAPGSEEAVAAARERMISGQFNVFDGVMETNDGQKVGEPGGTLSDETITSGIDWYYRNIIVMEK
jgi:basic membrane protein A